MRSSNIESKESSNPNDVKNFEFFRKTNKSSTMNNFESLNKLN